MCINVDGDFRLRQRIIMSRLWPLEITRSLAPLGKAAESKQVRPLYYDKLG